MSSWRNGQHSDETDTGDPFEPMRKLPESEFESGIFRHRARIDFLFRIRQRKWIHMKLGGKAQQYREQTEIAPHAQWRGRDCVEPERVLGNGDRNNRHEKDQIV